MPLHTTKAAPRAWLGLKSVKLKFVVSNFVLVVSIIVFVVLYFPMQQRQQQLAAFDTELRVLTETLAIAIAMEDDNYESMRFAFDFARQDDRLAYIVVTDTDGSVIASYPEDIVFDPLWADTTRNVAGRDTLVYRASMQVGQRHYGYVFIGRSGWGSQPCRDHE